MLRAGHAGKQPDTAFFPVFTLARGWRAGRRKASIEMLVAAAVGHHAGDLGRLHVGRPAADLLRQQLCLISILQSPMVLDSIERNSTAGPSHAFWTNPYVGQLSQIVAGLDKARGGSSG